ncbi:MAG: anti-sigma factor family protein, partial [Pseudomonadota bacterium]
MSCDEIRELLSAYIDGELDAARSLEVERHLEGCAACEAVSARLRDLGEAVRTHAPYYRAPASLRSRLRASVGVPAKEKAPARAWGRWAMAASLVIAVALGYT